MRKLKLQMQVSVDGYVAGKEGQLDWMTWNWDDALKTFVSDLHTTVDTILLGRNMTEGFVAHWENVVTNGKGTEEYPFAKLMVDYKKVIFSKKLEKPIGLNSVLAKGELEAEVNALKNQSGKDMIVYGGANFVSNLIEKNLIDELYLFVNPVALSDGLTIFKSRKQMELLESKSFACGIIVNKYKLI